MARTYKEQVTASYKWIVDNCKKDGICTLSTCDHANWNQVEHAAMHNDVSRLLRESGYTVSSKVNWGVTDWTITRPVTLDEVMA